MVFSELEREFPDETVQQLFREAWAVRERAYVVGPTRVGCAVLSSDGHIFVGCNVEHRYRCHDVHAEVNAITTMISAGEKQIRIVAIAAVARPVHPMRRLHGLDHAVCGGALLHSGAILAWWPDSIVRHNRADAFLPSVKK